MFAGTWMFGSSLSKKSWMSDSFLSSKFIEPQLGSIKRSVLSDFFRLKNLE